MSFLFMFAITLFSTYLGKSFEIKITDYNKRTCLLLNVPDYHSLIGNFISAGLEDNSIYFSIYLQKNFTNFTNFGKANRIFASKKEDFVFHLASKYNGTKVNNYSICFGLPSDDTKIVSLNWILVNDLQEFRDSRDFSDPRNSRNFKDYKEYKESIENFNKASPVLLNLSHALKEFKMMSLQSKNFYCYHRSRLQLLEEKAIKHEKYIEICSKISVSVISITVICELIFIICNLNASRIFRKKNDSITLEKKQN